MRAFLPTLFFFLWNSMLLAQNGTSQNAGARGAGMGNASITFTDIHSLYVNQAGLGFVEYLSFSVYGERRFVGVDGLNSFLVGVAYPNEKIGTFGLSLHYFGYDKYNEQKIGLAYARKLTKYLSIGAQFNYLGTRIGDYGSAHSFTFELGLLAKVTKHFHLAVHAYSPVQIQLPSGDKIPSIFKLGGAYMPSSKVRIAAEIEKDLENPFVGRFGLEYHPLDVLYIRAGVATTPLIGSFGLGLKIKSLRIDIASSYHIVLGFTPSLGLSYRVGEKQKATQSTPH